MTLPVAYLLVRNVLGCLLVLTRREASKDAELLVLRRLKLGIQASTAIVPVVATPISIWMMAFIHSAGGSAEL